MFYFGFIVIMFYILLIAVSCHVPVCVRLSHSIKRLLTYLLTYLANSAKWNRRPLIESGIIMAYQIAAMWLTLSDLRCYFLLLAFPNVILAVDRISSRIVRRAVPLRLLIFLVLCHLMRRSDQDLIR